MKIDLSGVPDSMYLEPGEHEVYIYEVAYDQARESRNPLFILTYKNSKGQIATERYVNTPNALWRVKNLARAVGCKDFANFETESLPGMKLRIKTIKESVNGKDYTKVSEVFPSKGDEEYDPIAEDYDPMKKPDPF